MPADAGGRSRLISSRQNPRFRAALELRDGAERRRRGRILIDGASEIAQAHTAGIAIVEAWVSPDGLGDVAAHLVLALRSGGVKIIEADTDLLERLGYGERSDGRVVVAERPERSLDELVPGGPPLIVVVDRIEKPGNLGAVLRSADGVGADAVIATDPVAEVWNPNAIRASLGTIFTRPLVEVAAMDARAWTISAGIPIFTARVDAELAYHDADLSGGAAIVVGSEADGLDRGWAGDGVTPVRIPMLGAADSLNVAATAAILLYEARRQEGSWRR